MLGIGAGGQVVSTSLPNLPMVPNPQYFTRARWQKLPTKRFQIVEDLLRQNPLLGMDVKRFINILGPTDKPGWQISMDDHRLTYLPKNWRLGTGDWSETSD